MRTWICPGIIWVTISLPIEDGTWIGQKPFKRAEFNFDMDGVDAVDTNERTWTNTEAWPYLMEAGA